MATSYLNFALESKKALISINLKRCTTYNHFKPAQIQCIKSAKDSDTLAILPTGYGKSLIFEALPYIHSSAVLVITPLNSIIKEQVERYGGDCVKFDASFFECEENILPDNVKYIIGHPEDFISKKSFQFFKRGKWQHRVSHVIIDEAHCVSQWGNGFRDKFLDIVKLRSLFPCAKVLALTATATLTMQQEIIQLLGLRNCKIILCNMDRSNIKIEVKRRPSGCGRSSHVEESYDFVFDPLFNELREQREHFLKTVVYTKLKWCGYGYEKGFRLSTTCDSDLKEFVAQYHSPCTAETRDNVLTSMADRNGRTKLLFATEAYSMGTDAPDVRRIVHAGVPTRLETYIQEIGRAGRDGFPATATIYYNNTDISHSVKGMTEEMRRFCTLETCRRDFLCQHFGFSSGTSIFINKHECCDNCEKLCACEECSCKNQLLSVQPCVKKAAKNKLSHGTSEQLECSLMEYFDAENEIIATQNAELLSGLSTMLAKEICKHYSLYTDETKILLNHNNLSPHVAVNIASIVKAVCQHQ